MIKNLRYTYPLTQFALAGLLTLSTGFASAQEMTLQDNKLQISGGSGTTFSSQSPTISALGVVQTVLNVPSTNGVGIPSFNFTTVASGVANGDYIFRVGVTFTDANVANRRLEAEIGILKLSVLNGVITGSIPAQNMTVYGRNGSGSLQVQITVTNSGDNGPVTVSGGTVSFNATNLISRIRSSHAQFDSIILAEFDQPATYNYRIAIQKVSTTAAGDPTIKFGTGPTFAAFPLVQDPVCGTANCVDNTTAFVLNGNDLASDYKSAYTVTGSFNVVTVSSSTDTGSTTTTTPTASNVTSEVAAIVIPPAGTPVSDAVKQQVTTAVANTNTLLTDTETKFKAGTATTADVFAAITAGNAALNKSGGISQSTGADSSNVAGSTTAVTKIAGLLSALTAPGKPALSQAQKDEISSLVTSTVENATKLMNSSTSSAAVLGLVEAASKLLQSSSGAVGGLTPALTTQLNALSTKATQTILPTLPESIRGNTDLNSVDAIRLLASAKATVADVVLKGSPEACSRDARNAAYSEHSLSLRNLGPTARKFGRNSPEYLAARDKHRLAHSEKYRIAREYRACVNGFTNDDDDNDNEILAESHQPLLFALSTEQPKFISNDQGFLIEFEGKKYSAAVSSARVVSDLLGDGVHTLPAGSLLYISANIGRDLTGTPLSGDAVENALSDTAFNLLSNTDGRLSIELNDNGERFAGAFALDDLGDASTVCDSVTFTEPTGNPTSADYAFNMTCSGGATQRITPYLDNAEFFTSVANSGLDLRMNRNTGIVSIDTVGNFRPSFFVMPLTINDTAYYNATKNAEGIAFRSLDANGDGKVDYEVISANGVQLLYGL